jgi:hypothetical protein
MKHCISLAAALLLATSLPTTAQQLTIPSGTGRHQAIAVDRTSITGPAEAGSVYLGVMSSNGFTISSSDDDKTIPMFTATRVNNNLVRLDFPYNFYSTATTATLTLTAPDGTTATVDVTRPATTIDVTEFTPYTSLAIASATSTSEQSGEGIERSFDGDMSTLYHSSYNSTKFPISLTYTLKEQSHLDRIVYYPRQSGNNNGNFGEIVVYANTGSGFNKVLETDLGYSSAASIITIPEGGLDNVTQVRILVRSGANNFASCAEIEFQQENTAVAALIDQFFTDDMCTALKSGVTEAQIASIPNDFLRNLAYQIYSGNYDTTYRVAEFEAYKTISTLASELKTNTYNAYENPTGIFFRADESVVIFAEGISDSYPVKLIVKNFGDPGSDSSTETQFALTNGVNVVKPSHRGNGYVSYYTDDFENAPKVKLHFASSTVNGYFDAERGDTNAQWKQLLANATSDIMDIRTKRLQVAFSTSRLRAQCPDDAESLAKNLDKLVYREREIMGLQLFDKEPKNRQFARCVWSGFMYADGVGAAAEDGSSNEWMQPSASSFGWWSMGHELGHVNQVRPSFKWVGCGETTNNVYSCWVQFSEGPGELRLEHEVTGIGNYSSMRGGRFEAYLENGVRQGQCWQLQEGPDYYGTTPDQVSVQDEDENGNKLSTVTTDCRNYDHFVKVAPLWQLQLYCHQAGFSPNVYGKVINTLRAASDANMTNGQQQIRFIRTVCDETGLDFTEFFEKAGMLKPIHAYINDYSCEWLVITQSMIDELKTYVAGKGYAKPQGEINYICGNNWETYANKAALQTSSTNAGCSLSNNRVTVKHDSWKNAVAFETYNAAGELLHISMYGLGGDDANTYTQVLFPSGASYIMAVGWDGTRVKCYQK